MELVSQNAVVVCRAFNLPIITQIWLVNHGIISEEYLENSIFTPAIVQINADHFELMFLPERLQASPATVENGQDIIKATIGRIVEKLPHTPYTGVGLNFIWVTRPLTKIEDFGRRLFFQSDGPFGSEFSSADARFGAYLSKDFSGMRLKLSVIPVVGPDASNRFQLSFNYHSDVSDSTEIVNKLGIWTQAREYSEVIANLLGKWLQ